MYLLYLDDSGSAQNQSEETLVLGGVSVFERQAHYFTKCLDDIAKRLAPRDPASIEFHASAIWAGRTAPWDSMKKEERISVIKEVLQVTATSFEWTRAFACAVHKPSYPTQDPMEITFEDLCSRFDMLLRRVRDVGGQQKGLIILDESASETTLQRMARDFQTLGTRWNVISEHC